MSTLTASHLRSPPPTLESLLTDSHDAFTQQDLGGISMDMFDPALSISAYDHSAFSAPFQPPTSTLNDGATQSPGAGPSRSTRPNRASRPTSFKTFLTLEGDEDFQQGASDGGSGFDTDGDGDEYVGDGGVNGVNEDDGADEDEDEGFREGDSDDDYDFGLPASQRSRASSSARTPKARKVTRLTPAAHADRSRSQSVNTGTAKKRSARNHIVIHSSVPADELRTVNVNATSTTSTAGNATPLGAGAAGSNRSRSASRSLPPSRTEKKFKCTWEDCGKAYTKPARLREHELSHTGERPHVCPYCAQSYIRPTHLTAHLRTHMSEEAKRYVCSVEGCGKRFWTGTHARRHEELHDEPMGHICEHCPAKFHKANQLRDHVALEHMPAGTKGYWCSHPGCGASFGVKQQLKAHERTHDPSRYTCAHPSHPTPLNFPNWSLLQSHLSAAHPPQCPVEGCGKVFKAVGRLKEHLKVHERAGEYVDELSVSVSAGISGTGTATGTGIRIGTTMGEGQGEEVGREGTAAATATAGTVTKTRRKKRTRAEMEADAAAAAAAARAEGNGNGADGNETEPARPGKKKKCRPSKNTRMANAAAAAAAAAAGSTIAPAPATAAPAGAAATVRGDAAKHGSIPSHLPPPETSFAFNAHAHGGSAPSDSYSYSPYIYGYGQAGSSSTYHSSDVNAHSFGLGLAQQVYGDEPVPSAGMMLDLDHDPALDPALAGFPGSGRVGGNGSGSGSGGCGASADGAGTYFTALLPAPTPVPVPINFDSAFDHAAAVGPEQAGRADQAQVNGIQPAESDSAAPQEMSSALLYGGERPTMSLNMSDMYAASSSSAFISQEHSEHAHADQYGYDYVHDDAHTVGNPRPRTLACPVHLLPATATATVNTKTDPDATSATGARPTTCFAMFDKAYNVARHLKADHGVEMDLQGIKDLLGL